MKEAYFVMEMVHGHDLRKELDEWKGLPHAERFQKSRVSLFLL